MQTDDRVAIVGIGSLLPDALDAQSLWRNLLARHCALRQVPPEIWDPAEFYGSEYGGDYHSTTKLGGVVRGLQFSAREFGIPPSVEQSLDLTQKAALLAAREALVGAGIHGPTGGDNCAVIIGNSLGGVQIRGEYLLLIVHRLLERTIDKLPVFRSLSAATRVEFLSELRRVWCSQFTPITGDSLPGVLSNIIAARIAHFYNFHGPTQTVDAACASSLAALDCAVSGLKTKRFDLALAGGVDFMMDPVAYIGFSRMHALSDAGSFPFDVRASGFVMGEGAVLFVLKRLKDAHRANDRVLAVIESIGCSSDGRGNALIAPSMKGQRVALRRAYSGARVSPTDVAYVEAHGTATAVGDPIEILALRDVFGDCRGGSIALGSVKANVGHLKAAAGAAGLLRAVLALDSGVIPPQANFEVPNPRCKFDSSPFRIPIEAEEWPRDKVCAAVSAFGFGGINYHCVLRTAEGGGVVRKRFRRMEPLPCADAHAHGVAAFGAASDEGLIEIANSLAGRLSKGEPLGTLLGGCGEPQFEPNRLAFYAADRDAAARTLESAIRGMRGGIGTTALETSGIYWRSSRARRDSLALMFPGQGSQYLGMLDELRSEFPIIEQTLREADEILAGEFPQPLSAFFARPTAAADHVRAKRLAALTQTRVLQPTLVACNEALRRALLQFCAPTIVFGHSLGEISACIAAGVMTFEAGLRFAAVRGRVLSEVDGDGGSGVGGLLQVAASPEKLEQTLGGLPDGVALASRNCTAQTVIGGRAAALRLVQRRLRAAGVDCSLLPVSGAFHTPRMQCVVAALRAHLEGMELCAPRLLLISSVTGKAIPRTKDPREWFANLLSQQVAKPVEFVATIQRAYECGARTFIEVGPKRVLCGFVDDVLRRSERNALACCSPKEGEQASFGQVLAALVGEGLIPLQAHSVKSLSMAPLSPRLPRAQPGASKGGDSDVEGIQQWALRRISHWLNVPQTDLRLDASLEEQLGVDTARQGELFARLAAESGRDSVVRAGRRQFPDLRSLLDELNRGSVGAEGVPGRGFADCAVPSGAPGSTVTLSQVEASVGRDGASGAGAGFAGPAGAGARSAPIAETVLRLVMDRTGYTRSELDLDANLEQVLGIDSIVQVEVVAELQETLGLSADDTFRVSNYPTLRHLIGYAEGKLSQDTAVSEAEAREAGAPSHALVRPYFCHQLRHERVQCCWKQADRGRLLVVHDGSGARLRAGIGADSLALAEDGFEARVGDALKLDPDTLIIVSEAPGNAGDSLVTVAECAAACVLRIGGAFLRAEKKVRPVVLITGASDRNLASRVWTGAWIASWKSVYREWSAQSGEFADNHLQVLEIAGSLDSHADEVLAAIARAGPCESRFDVNAGWTTPVLRPFEPPATGGPSTSPVAVVTGGARGITARVAVALFEATGCRLVLVGRTAPGEDGTSFEVAGARVAAREALGPDASPAEISAKVEEQRRRAEVTQTLEALRVLGAEIEYVRADVTDANALAQALDRARDRFGRVDWVIHGAGIDHSHAIRSASQISLSVLRTKLAGLSDPTISRCAGIKWIALSSISALYGNTGQLEYAAANQAMARIVLEHGGLVLDFGPWRDVGMAATLHGLLTARGVDTLPSAAAARCAAALVAAGETGEYVIAGRLGRNLGSLAGQGASIELDVPGTQYAASVHLECSRVGWLRDHHWQGGGLLPGVISLAMMTDAARRIEPSAPVSTIKDLSLRERVLVRPDERMAVTVEAERVSGDGNERSGGIAVGTRIQCGGRTVHSATVLLGSADIRFSSSDRSPLVVTRALLCEDLYAKFFHGPSFRVLESVQIGAAAALGTSKPLGCSLGTDLPEESRYSALAREAALQTAGAYLLFERSLTALPEGFTSCHIESSVQPGEHVQTEVLLRSLHHGTVLFDAWIRGARGQVLERIEGLRFRCLTVGSSPVAETGT